MVVEHVGDATWAKSMRSLARNGRLVTCGATTGGDAGVDLLRAVQQAPDNPRVLHGHEGRAASGGQRLFVGRLKPVIDRTFPLADAAAAQQRLEASGQFGKIVLEV